MKKEYIQFEKFIKAYVNDITNLEFIKLNSDDWQSLFSILRSQNLASEVFSLVEKLPQEQKPELKLYNKWHSSVIKSASIQLIKVEKNKALFEALNLEGIKYKVIKGMSTAVCYPVPEFRLMSDLDLHVVGKDYKYINQYMKSHGFKTKDKECFSPMHISYLDDNGNTIEIHKKLHQSKFMNKYELDYWLQCIGDTYYKFTNNEYEIDCLTPEDAIIHHILHFARHLTHHGAKFRQILDIIMIIKKHQNSLNYDYINFIFQESKMIEFTSVLFAYLCEAYDFDIPELKKEFQIVSKDELTDFLLGEINNSKYKDQYRFYSFITSRFPILIKLTIFKPLIFLGEIVINVIINKFNLNKSISSAKLTIKNNRNRLVMLRRLNLIN